MKTNHTLLLLAVLSASITIRLAAQSADTTAPPDTIEADTTNMTTIDTVPADTVAPTMTPCQPTPRHQLTLPRQFLHRHRKSPPPARQSRRRPQKSETTVANLPVPRKTKRR